MWLEIWPVWFDFKPLVGNLTSGWKFHRGWLEFWPGALEYMVGNPTNLNHAKYKKILKPSLVQILKVKVLSFFRSRKWDFLQLRWGTRLSSTGLLLGPLMPEKRTFVGSKVSELVALVAVTTPAAARVSSQERASFSVAAPSPGVRAVVAEMVCTMFSGFPVPGSSCPALPSLITYSKQD